MHILFELDFQKKIICCIAFILASSACCLLKSIAIILNHFLNKDSLASNQLHNISLTKCNLWNVVICSYIIFYGLIQKVSFINHNLLIFYFYSWKNIFCVCVLFDVVCVLFDVRLSQIVKQNVYLLLEHLDQLSNRNISFVPL